MTTHEPTIRIENREEMLYLLAEAAAIEHNLMCCYLYAAWSLKRGVEDGLSAGRGDRGQGLEGGDHQHRHRGDGPPDTRLQSRGGDRRLAASVAAEFPDSAGLPPLRRHRRPCTVLARGPRPFHLSRAAGGRGTPGQRGIRPYRELRPPSGEGPPDAERAGLPHCRPPLSRHPARPRQPPPPSRRPRALLWRSRRPARARRRAASRRHAGHRHQDRRPGDRPDHRTGRRRDRPSRRQPLQPLPDRPPRVRNAVGEEPGLSDPSSPSPATR